jgi:dTDP-4-dehydrorhamnose reductase
VHAVNHGETTWHGFAQQIALELGAEAEIVPVTSREYPRAAERPHYSVLDTTRLQAVLGQPLPSWQDALKRYLEGSPCVR